MNDFCFALFLAILLIAFLVGLLLYAKKISNHFRDHRKRMDAERRKTDREFRRIDRDLKRGARRGTERFKL